MKNFINAIVAMMVVLLICVPSAIAITVDIDNESFEDYTGTLTHNPGYGSHTVSGINGWDFSGAGIAGVWNPTANQYTAPLPAGNMIGFMTAGTLSQTTSHLVTANNEFTLTIDIGNRLDRFFPAYEVRLLAGDAILDSGSISVTAGTFETLTLSYIAYDGDNNIGNLLGIEIFSEGIQLNFDNIELTNDSIVANVPEPATIVLTLTGMFCLAGVRRKLK